MNERVRRLVERHPVPAYVLLCYAITWTGWFCIPLVVGTDWTLVKIFTGVTVGPGLAAVLLDRARGKAGEIGTGRWWAVFATGFVVVTAIDLSSLLTGDAPGIAELAAAEPPGLTPVGVVGSTLAGAACAFVLASAACSRSRALRSILSWRAPIRYWLVASLLIAGLSLGGLAITLASGAEMPPAVGAGVPTATWALFVLRSTLFTLFVVAVGEETGWRGWMLPELQRSFSPLVSSLVVGLVWGLWHLPLFFNGMYPGEPVQIVGYLVMCPFLALLFTWLYNRTGGNLLLALVLHTALNNTSRVLPNTSWSGWLGVVLVVVLVFTDRMWRRRARP